MGDKSARCKVAKQISEYSERNKDRPVPTLKVIRIFTDRDKETLIAKKSGENLDFVENSSFIR